jgi:peptide-methionine (S)-S-oxide reductase
MLGRKSLLIPARENALPGRFEPIQVTDRHFVLGRPLKPPFPLGIRQVMFGMGCFWGAERLFWQLPGVFTTAAGYAGGHTQNATYEEVCTGYTGHTEVVLVAYDPTLLPFATLLATFWQSHDPTQGMRQGADIGTQYRSALFCYGDDQLDEAERSRDQYQKLLTARRLPRITTAIDTAPALYYAEDYHQQYLAKNPGGYCGIGGCGVPYVAAASG